MYGLLLLTIFTLLTPLLGQELPGTSDRVYSRTPVGYRFDGKVDEWNEALFIPSSADGLSPGIWIRSTAAGLIFAGNLHQAADRVEMILAGPRDFAGMPPGWSTRFGYQVHERRASCATGEPNQNVPACEAWFDRTLRYQGELGGLFLRRFIMTNQEVVETAATPAWKALQARLTSAGNDTKGHPLKPAGMPSYRSSGESFEIEVPWSALPPWDSLTVESFRWSIRVDDANSDPKAAVLRKAMLLVPRKYRLTNCNQVLPAAPYDQAWIRPGDALVLNEVAILDYPLSYHPSFEPDIELAPIVTVKSSFSDALAPGIWFCGPEAAQGWGTQTSVAEPRERDFRGGRALPGKYRKQRLPDGRWLIATAPMPSSYGWMGGGQCGSCLVWTSQVWLLASAGIQRVATFESERLMDRDFLDWDLHYGPDLRFVDLYQESIRAGQWTRQRYCFAGRSYRPCGPHVRQAPIKRVTKTPEETMGNP